MSEPSAKKSSHWVKSAAIYTTAVLFSLTVLPASVVGWYYADPQSFGAAIGTAIDYSQGVKAR